MTKNRIVYAALAVAGLLFASLPAGAEDAISHPAKKPIGPTKNEMVPSLPCSMPRARGCKETS